MPDSSFVSLISSIINPGGLDPFALCSIFVCLYFLSSTNFKVCKEGVAVPRIIGIFLTCALLILTSLAENLNPSCCLYDWSCSSSIIINPKLYNGHKTADLVPITIFISPLLALCQRSNLCFGVCLE